MKKYLIVMGALFTLMTAVHIWKAVEEWPKHADRGFVAEAAALIVIPALFAMWAWWLLWRTSRQPR